MHPPPPRFRAALFALLAVCALALALTGPAHADPSGFPSRDRAAGGTVVAWGSNTFGQTSVPPGLSGVVQVAAGRSHSLALRGDGTVVAWGDNSQGQTSVPPGLSGVIQVTAGEHFSAALKSDGTVVAWGDNSSGQLNIPPDLRNVVQISGGDDSLFALTVGQTTANGVTTPSVQIHGTGTTNMFGVSGTRSVDAPVIQISANNTMLLALRSDGKLEGWLANIPIFGPPTQDDNIQQVATGGILDLILKGDGTVLSTGGNYTTPAGLSGVVQVASGGAHGLALKADGTVVAWGANAVGQLSVPPGLSGVVQVAAGGAHSLAIVSGERRLVAWGGGGAALVPADLGPVTQMAAGLSHGLAVRQNGAVVAWGGNASGQASVPPGLTAWQVAAGWNHSLALRSDGTVAAWGSNDSGQSATPAGLVNVRQIAAGAFHSLALRSDGTVTAWGNSLLSTPPAGLAEVREVAAGAFHSVALRITGEVVVWGENTLGQRNLPAFTLPVKQVAAGNNHSLALLSDGTVVAWGDNRSGQSSVPPGLSGVVQVAARGNHSLALLSDGTAVAWGGNDSGQSSVPPGLSGASQIAAGNSVSMALTIDRQAPDTTISAAPAPLTNSPAALVSFIAGDSGGAGVAGSECSLNGAPFAACASPQSYSGLAEGSYTVRVRSSDRFGNVEQSPAEASWTVDTTAPAAPTITAPTNGARLATRRPTISGSAEPLSTVTVTAQAGGPTVGMATADASGSWSLTPAGDLADGPYTLSARAADPAGNLGPASPSVTFTVDTVGPSVTVAPAPGQADPASSGPLRFLATFSEPMSAASLTPADLDLSGSGPGALTATIAPAPGDGSAFVIEVGGMGGDGTVTVGLGAGRAADLAGNPNVGAGSASVAYDPTAPAATLSTTAGSRSNAAAIPVTVSFSEPVSGLTAADVELVNATLSDFSGAGASYSFALAPLADGPVSVRLPAGAAADRAGNLSAAASLSLTSDRTAPKVIVAAAPGQANPAASAPIRFMASFSEPVSGLSLSDLQLGGAAGPRAAALSELAPFDGTSFAIEVSGMARAGAVTLALPTGAATDAAGNPSAGGEASISFAPAAPAVTGIAALGPSPTNAAGVRYRVSFSEPVSGVDAADFVLTTDLGGAGVIAVSGGGAEWTVSVSTGSGEGSLRLDLTDDDSISSALAVPLGGAGAGNGGFSAGAVYRLDRSAPTALLVAPPQVERGAASASFAVSYADNLALLASSLGGGAVRVSGPGGLSQPAALVSLSPEGDGVARLATYRVDAPAGGWPAGSYTIALVAGQASDTAGNKASAAQLGAFTVEAETTAPGFRVYLPALIR